MSFDSQKKIINKNNPIDYIEDYVLDDDIETYRLSRDEITISSKGIWKNYKISVKGQNYITVEQVQDFIDLVTSECDRFFPVFFVFFYKKQDPVYALDIAVLDTYGEA